MPKKIEEVYYCDFCKAKKEPEDIILECVKPVLQPENVPANRHHELGALPPHAVSSIRITDHVGVKRNTFQISNAVMCKDCLAKQVGFDSWNDLRKGAGLVSAEHDRQNQRGGPFDR
jgi:hypothetical protein